MKGVIFNRYSSPDVLEYTEVTKPSPTAKQLLIKVFASSVNPVDWKIRRGMLKFIIFEAIRPSRPVKGCKRILQ
ncbi:oxidoreductase zinc-binding protein [Crocosphaera chwakensis]|uniref:Oxidoreductase, zinc-binding protein n=1 Tax=Crocosphaera chwakensis CCY0110 TaxID=391612 RepID=A3IWX7_9CHRO|nr:oxidoreductase zinc-binding protein [Crocosphaera chwakensis]EAZ89028.1 oxidoreductase, zinc-binding protein [Crocosphaera chwakensis CCY0110]